MLEEELLYVLALQRVKGIGDINAKKLIAHFGSARNVLNGKKKLMEKVHGIGALTIQHLWDPDNLKKAEKELRYLEKNNITTHYYQDSNYPDRLKHCVDGPILFFSKGTIDFKDRHVISIVGTRKMTRYGKDFCKKLIVDLMEFNPIIVSGFAYGVDICAHKAAYSNQLQTIGVLAHGFEEIYPKTHGSYVNEIMKKGGFITEFWHDEIMIKENFLKRNRIVAGLSEATIIIESAEKGGSLVTADIANSYNRDVFAVPGRSTDIFSTGCNNLIKYNKAALLTSAKDLSESLNWNFKKANTNTIQKQLFIELSKDEQLIVDFLIENGKEILDLIALNCQLTIQQTTTILFHLEMKGVVKPLPGRMYEAF